MGKYENVKNQKKNGKLKLLIVVGIKTKILRLTAVINRVRQYFDVILTCMRQYFDVILAHTGQNYDYNLNGVFFRFETAGFGGLSECGRRR